MSETRCQVSEKTTDCQYFRFSDASFLRRKYSSSIVFNRFHRTLSRGYDRVIFQRTKNYMKKIIVAAKSRNNIIGINNDLAWSMPADLKHYHDLVREGWAIMGRTTYESTYEPVPLQKTIVVTRNKDYRTEDNTVKIVNNLERAFEYAKENNRQEVFVLGGGNIYEQAINMVDEMVITEIEVEVDGDTIFPNIDLNEWQITKKIKHKADNENPYDYAFVFYKWQA